MSAAIHSVRHDEERVGPRRVIELLGRSRAGNRSSTASARAASSTVRTIGAVAGLAGFLRSAIRRARGTASLSSWSCLA